MVVLAALRTRHGRVLVAVSAAQDELGDGASLDALVRLALRKSAK